MKFDQLGLDPLILKAITEKGYTEPSPIQAQAIPAVLKGGDVMAAAQTGTGKTAGFTLPILHLLAQGKRARDKQVRTLILTPTRELAAQVFDNVQTYGKHLNLCTQMVFGGVSDGPQIRKLKLGADILIATPGRLLDLIEQRAMKFERLEMFVLDEADRMLDMGFIRDIKKVIALLPKKRQNLLFSATFSDSIRKLSRELIQNPTEISVNAENTTADTVTQWIHPLDREQKTSALIKLIKTHGWEQTLVFCRTKHSSNRLATFLEKKGISAAAIHGNKSQNARAKALSAFKAGKVSVLVATDIAARGIDIRQLPQVVNFDLPEQAEDYVHRIGRTGRAGSEGQAISFASAEELYYLVAIEKLIQRLIPRKTLEGFEPQNPLPEAPLGTRVPKPKKKTSGGQGRGSRPPQRQGQGRSRNSANNTGTARKSAGPRDSRSRRPRRQRRPNK